MRDGKGKSAVGSCTAWGWEMLAADILAVLQRRPAFVSSLNSI
jgi:hypothetical protein